MKVCHVITRLVLGGAQENTLLTCEGLAAAGHDVTLVTGPAIGPEGDLFDRARAGNYETIMLEAMRRAIHPLRDASAYRGLKRCLRRIQPDIMHSHSSKAGILARHAAAAVGGIKSVHTIHGLPFHPYQSWAVRRLYVVLERRAARVTDAIIGVAESMIRQAADAHVPLPAETCCIPSAMEVQPYLNRPAEADAFRAKMGLGDRDVLITQVSRLAALKGHCYLLAAAAAINRANVHFCFVGDGHLRRSIERDIARLHLGGRVHLAGLVRPEHIPAVMHASDIVAHCSLHEGLPRAVVQGMLAARPIVCFDVDGAAEVVDDTRGILVPPADAMALTGALRRLIESPDLREDMGQSGRQRCAEPFDHREMVRAIGALYERLLK